jgi:negative regulator of sigma E activity
MGDRMWTHLYGHAPILPFMHTKYLEPWLHGAIIEFAVSAAVMIAVSLRTAPEPAEKLATTTIAWGARSTEPKLPFWTDYKPWLAIVLTAAVALYVIFSIGVI